MLSKKLVGGELVPVEDSCVLHALNVYKKRHEKDTHPAVVKMILRGEPVPHYYYRSDQWIDQPYLVPFALLQPYVGPADQADASIYGSGTYKEDKDIADSLPGRLETILDFLYKFHGIAR